MSSGMRALFVDVDEITTNGFSLAVRRYVDSGAPPIGEAPAQTWRRVELKNYRVSLEASIELAPFTVLVGPNGSGKSNFADAIVFARDVAADAATAIEARGRRRHHALATGGGPSGPRWSSISAPRRRARRWRRITCVIGSIRARGDRGWAFRSETIELFAEAPQCSGSSGHPRAGGGDRAGAAWSQAGRSQAQ